MKREREGKENQVEEQKPHKIREQAMQRSSATKHLPLLSASRGYSALISAALFPGSSGRAWVKLMQGHVLAAYYLLQF